MAHETDQEAIWGLLSEGAFEPLPDLTISFNEHSLQEILVEAGLPKSSAERVLMDRGLRERIQQDLTEVCWRWLATNASINYAKQLAPPTKPQVNPRAHPKPGETQWSAS